MVESSMNVEVVAPTADVDLSGYLEKAGGTMTGPLILAGPPTDPMGAATKAYADGMIPADILTDAPADGVQYARKDSAWEPVTAPVAGASATIGDFKYGFQAADHAGWIKLDGRELSTLTTTQADAAVGLGFATNLPDATGVVAMQGHDALGLLVGQMDRSLTIAQANLPDVSLTAASAGAHTHPVEITGLTTSPAGAHNHLFQSNVNDQGQQNFNEMLAGAGGDDPGSVYPAIKWRGTAAVANTANNGTVINGYAMDGADDHTHPVSNSGGTISEAGAHEHTVALGGSGTALALDVIPKSISANAFVYLGA